MWLQHESAELLAATAAAVAVQLNFFFCPKQYTTMGDGENASVPATWCLMKMVCVSTFDNYNLDSYTRVAHTHTPLSSTKMRHIQWKTYRSSESCLFIWSDYDPCSRFQEHNAHCTQYAVRTHAHSAHIRL